MIMMNRMYYSQSDTEVTLYVPKVEGGQWLLCIVNCVETEEQILPLYLDQLEERLLRFSKSERILPQNEGPVSTAKKLKKKDRHKQWNEKQLHGNLI